MELKQTAPESHAALKRLYFSSPYIPIPLYLFFHVRPRYSHFNLIAACYLYSCLNLIPGKVMEQNCETDKNTLVNRVHVFSKLLESKMSHLKKHKIGKKII